MPFWSWFLRVAIPAFARPTEKPPLETTSQTKIFIYIGKFDRGAILNNKPVSPWSYKRKARDWMRYLESDYSVTRISRLNAMLGKWMQCCQKRQNVAYSVILSIFTVLSKLKYLDLVSRIDKTQNLNKFLASFVFKIT